MSLIRIPIPTDIASLSSLALARVRSTSSGSFPPRETASRAQLGSLPPWFPPSPASEPVGAALLRVVPVLAPLSSRRVPAPRDDRVLAS